MQDPDLDRAPIAPRRAEGVPVIDIDELDPAALSGESSAVGAIARACRDWGFFQVVNHGIDAGLIDRTWTQTRDFFARPHADKEVVTRSRDNPWGFYNNELTKNRRDRKEVFDFTSDGPDPIYAAVNRWPSDDAFRETLVAYRDACEALAGTLLRAMCAGLELEPTVLDRHFEKAHTGFVRLNYYPVRDPLEGRDDIVHLRVADRGVHHHTDAGALTLLLQDDVGGLQVYRDGFWYDVPPVDGALVINTGDMMQVWSNDRYRAAVHRVLAMSRQDRYSIPFFYNPDACCRVAPLSSLTGIDSPPRYRPIDWSEFRYRRTDGDYADFGAEVQIDQFRIGS